MRPRPHVTDRVPAKGKEAVIRLASKSSGRVGFITVRIDAQALLWTKERPGMSGTLERNLLDAADYLTHEMATATLLHIRDVADEPKVEE